MTDTSRLTELPSAASHAQHIGQATSVEQARAAAEVQALVIVAQNRPRTVVQSVADMEDSCRQKAFADRAFYDYTRGAGEDRTRITDLTVVAAKELARCWGNIQYSMTELRQDRERHESEVLTWAWDMQANNRVERKFIVPHVRDTKKGSRTLTDVRDVYELLANNGARRLRECIKDVLPPWYVEKAKELLWHTLASDGGEKPLPERRAMAATVFREEHNVTLDQLERRLERSSGDWTPLDLAKLRVIHTSLQQGLVTKAEEFPPERITTEALPAAPAEHIGMTRPAEPTKPSEPPPPALSVDQLDALLAALGKVGFDSLEEALPSVRALLGEPGLSNMYAMNPQQVTDLLGQLATIAADANPMAAMDAAVLLAQEQQDGQG